MDHRGNSLGSVYVPTRSCTFLRWSRASSKRTQRVHANICNRMFDECPMAGSRLFDRVWRCQWKRQRMGRPRQNIFEHR